MRLSRTVIVNALVLALGAASLGAVLITNASVTTEDGAGREQNLFPVFRAADVEKLDLTANAQQISLQRVNAGDGGTARFELVAPVKELADAASVDKFLAGLEHGKALRPVSEGLSRAALGLETPSARIAIKTAKLSYELALGAPAPAPEGARYAEVKPAGGAAHVVLVAKSVAEDLTFDLDVFRLRSVISVAQADVTRLSIKSPTLDVTLVRGAGKTFLLDGTQKLRADRETVSSLFFQLGRLTANRFLNSAEAEASLGANVAHFAVQTKSEGELRFDVGGACPGKDGELVIVRRAPGTQSACVSRELEATLGSKREAFIDQHAFSFHVDEVEELDLTTAESKLRLVRQGTGFVLHGKSDTDVELEPGNQRILDVLEARGELVPDAKLGELGLDPARTKLTLRSSAGSEAEVAEEILRVGNKDPNGNLFVYREADGVTLKIPREQARAFAQDSTLLYSRKLSQFGPSSFISTEIERAGGREVLTRGPNGELRLDSPKGFDADASLSADVVQTLGALTAERFVADADDGSFGLAHPRLTSHFAFKSEQSPKVEHTLRIGAETALGVYATLDDNGPVFVLPRTAFDTLDTLPISRTVVLDPAALQAVQLEARGRALRLERHTSELEPTPAGSFPQDRLPDLLEALASMRPEAAIHTGPPPPAEGFGKPVAILRLTPKTGAPQTVTVGAGDSWRATSVFYLRAAGVDATFVIAQSKVRALLDAL